MRQRNIINMKKRVVVAMSGGVDSSVAAYLLLKQGFEVIGVTLKLFNSKAVDTGRCCGSKGVNDAREVAFKLGIPFYVLNYVSEFKKEVVDYFSLEYKNGRTPNPCIICNEKIKFGSLLKKAMALNAEYLATGHYARVAYNKTSRRYVIKKGKDKNKEQSYFLFSLPQRSLRHALFPLGGYRKPEVRKLAKRIGIKVHNKPASQEICFIPDNNYKNFLIKRDPKIDKPGAILNTKGQVLGRHKGICFYTIGQRKGLGVAHKKPLYVLAINKRKNTIVVGEVDEAYSKGLIAKDINWVGVNGVNKPIRAKVKIRYKQPSAMATLSRFDKNKVKIVFDKAQSSITPGQAAVFYKGDTVLGGGVIEK